MPNKAHFIISGIVFVVLLAALGFFIAMQKASPTAMRQAPAPPEAPTALPPANVGSILPPPLSSLAEETITDTSGWKTYYSYLYGFSFRYPNYQAFSSWNDADRNHFIESPLGAYIPVPTIDGGARDQLGEIRIMNENEFNNLKFVPMPQSRGIPMNTANNCKMQLIWRGVSARIFVPDEVDESQALMPGEPNPFYNYFSKTWTDLPDCPSGVVSNLSTFLLTGIGQSMPFTLFFPMYTTSGNTYAEVTNIRFRSAPQYSGLLPQVLSTLAPFDPAELNVDKWQTYHNTRFGFSFRYPNSWDFLLGDCAMDGCPPKEESADLSVHDTFKNHLFDLRLSSLQSLPPSFGLQDLSSFAIFRDSQTGVELEPLVTVDSHTGFTIPKQPNDVGGLILYLDAGNYVLSLTFDRMNKRFYELLLENFKFDK